MEPLKYCNGLHSNQIAFYCKPCQLYVCEDCAFSYHMDHFDDLKALQAVFQKKLPKYLNVKKKAEFV